MTGITWTEELTRKVLSMNKEGISASIIAAETGLSKNAILGRLFRMKEKGISIREGQPRIAMDKGKKKTYFNRVDSGKPRKAPTHTYYKDTGVILTETWPAFKVDMAITLWNSGAGELLISKKIGCTRSAVSGKIGQLVKHGVIKRRGNGRPPESTRALFKGQYDQIRVNSFTDRGKNQIADFEANFTNKGISILDLKRNSCRYMTGETLYCGEPAESGSWCECHKKRVYVSVAA